MYVDYVHIISISTFFVSLFGTNSEEEENFLITVHTLCEPKVLSALPVWVFHAPFVPPDLATPPFTCCVAPPPPYIPSPRQKANMKPQCGGQRTSPAHNGRGSHTPRPPPSPPPPPPPPPQAASSVIYLFSLPFTSIISGLVSLLP